MALDRPYLVGLTGSIGMGKSATAKMFAVLGIPVFDADAAVHAMYEEGGEAVAEIAGSFPGCVKDGRVDCGVLVAKLGNDAAFAKLEAIVHPLVAKAERAFIEKARARGTEFVVLNIPLLFETGGDARMDAIVVVTAPPEIQRGRALARLGMSQARLDAILARQMPDAEKRARADFVVETDQGFDHAFEQVRKIVGELRKRRAEARGA